MLRREQLEEELRRLRDVGRGFADDEEIICDVVEFGVEHHDAERIGRGSATVRANVAQFAWRGWHV